MAAASANLPAVFASRSADLLQDWIQVQLSTSSRSGAITESELREQSREFIALMAEGLKAGQDTAAPAWKPVRELLATISRSRALQGFSPTDTAMFVFSLKQPVMEVLRQELDKDPRALADQVWAANLVLDRLGLFTTESYQQSRDAIIKRQQEELLELSTPVVQLWKGILALPLIGTLDSARTQVVMESLLKSIVDTGSSIAILDITGVPAVDTLVAQHLLKTVAAARLMGADCIISGIRPQIAQTIVHLGVDLTDVTTKATLADAFITALKRTGSSVERPA